MISFIHCNMTVIGVTNLQASAGSRCKHRFAYRAVAALCSILSVGVEAGKCFAKFLTKYACASVAAQIVASRYEQHQQQLPRNSS
jgi:hypothetical protein